MADLVAIRAKFERFPAAVKGALLLRGADGMPHQVRLEAAHAAELSGGTPQPVGVASVVLEGSPTQETFVPFEVSTMDMASGWYLLECDLVVDGDPEVVRPGDRFAIPWPRAANETTTGSISPWRPRMISPTKPITEPSRSATHLRAPANSVL